MNTLILVIGLVVWFAAELLVLYAANPKHFVGKPREIEKRTLEEVRVVASRGLTLIGLTAATLALLLNLLTTRPDLGEPAFLAVFSLVFFMVSFKFEVGGAIRRAYLRAQNQALDFGLIALALALALLYQSLSSALSFLPLALPAVAVAGHLWDFGYTLRYTLSQRGRGVS